MRVHEFKTWPEVYEAVSRGVKTFEFRDTSDREHPVEVGDFVTLIEWEDGCETGRSVEAFVPFVLNGPDFGVPEGCQVFSIEVRMEIDA